MEYSFEIVVCNSKNKNYIIISGNNVCHYLNTKIFFAFTEKKQFHLKRQQNEMEKQKR